MVLLEVEAIKADPEGGPQPMLTAHDFRQFAREIGETIVQGPVKIGATPAHYSPSHDIGIWWRQFITAADANQWTRDERLRYIPVYMSSKAAEVYLQVGTPEDLESAKAKLFELFGRDSRQQLNDYDSAKQSADETIEEFAARVNRLLQQAMPTLTTPESREPLVIQKLISGLRSVRARQHIYENTKDKKLAEVVKAARIAESAEKMVENSVNNDAMTMVVGQVKDIKLDSATPKTDMTQAEYKNRYNTAPANYNRPRESRLDSAHARQGRSASARGNLRGRGNSWRTPRPTASRTPSPFPAVARSSRTNQRRTKPPMQIVRERNAREREMEKWPKNGPRPPREKQVGFYTVPNSDPRRNKPLDADQCGRCLQYGHWARECEAVPFR